MVNTYVSPKTMLNWYYAIKSTGDFKLVVKHKPLFKKQKDVHDIFEEIKL
jgi:hypothetical protein